MIDYNYELREMVSDKNLMNSYKLFFLKALIVNSSIDKHTFSFYEMACWMCAYSFAYVCQKGKRLRHFDKLYDVAVLAIESEDLMESSKISEVYDAVYYTRNKQLRNLVDSLCNYVPYRLLSYLWVIELKGKNDKQKHQIIEELSRSDIHCIYAIYSISQVRKIVVNSDWINYIKDNRRHLIGWIDQRIDSFVWGKNEE